VEQYVSHKVWDKEKKAWEGEGRQGRKLHSWKYLVDVNGKEVICPKGSMMRARRANIIQHIKGLHGNQAQWDEV
jgi:hypothetical protein